MGAGDSSGRTMRRTSSGERCARERARCV